MFIEELESDYTWRIVKRATEYKIYRGSYLDEPYYICEQFDDDESVLSLYATDSIILDEGEKISLEHLEEEDSDYDFYGYHFELDSQNKSISVYKDEFVEDWEGDWLFLYNTGRSIMVFEDDEFILSEIEEELSSSGHDVEELFAQKPTDDELMVEFLSDLILGGYFIYKHFKNDE